MNAVDVVFDRRVGMAPCNGLLQTRDPLLDSCGPREVCARAVEIIRRAHEDVVNTHQVGVFEVAVVDGQRLLKRGEPGDVAERCKRKVAHAFSREDGQ